jgi:two-component system NtrC family sensor kinase
MRTNSLSFKVGFYLALALIVAVFLFTLLIVRYQREELLEHAVAHVTQLAEVMTKSTRYAMLRDQPSYVDEIISDVGAQEGVDRVRVLSKTGTIIHSSEAQEIGLQIDQQAESCMSCHRDEQSLRQSPMDNRARFFTNDQGQRMLGSTKVINNEPSCSDAGCHVHPKDQTVLGVLDIVYPLSQMDRELRTNTITIFGFSLGLVIVVSLFISLLVRRMVYLPLRDLKTGADHISSGNLQELIPIRSSDEFGQLATSFNDMTVALRRSQRELRGWGRTLEEKIEEKTRELHRAQAEAARGEKLASVGLLAAGIAHELNNPLTGVLTFSHLVRQTLPEDSPEAEDLDLVIQETKRCAAIIRRLLDFAREQAPEKKWADLNHLVDESVRLIEQPASLDGIEIISELDPEMVPIWVDEGLIKQVIMNMLVNAQHAIDETGTITVKTRVCSQQRCADVVGETVPAVELMISDTGRGIPEEDLHKIFDPFFTTKGVGKGTGLGLSVSHGTVRAHGGEIEVESTVDKGTTFRIYLPIAGTSLNGENKQ